MGWSHTWLCGAQATNEHYSEMGGAVFLVSSDVFTFSGLLSAADGVPAVRAWAITNTSLIAEVLALTLARPACCGYSSCMLCMLASACCMPSLPASMAAALHLRAPCSVQDMQSFAARVQRCGLLLPA